MEERIICDRVYELRNERGLTCEKVAEKLGMKVSTYCRYEESAGFSYSELASLANLFAVSLNYLLNGDETEPIFGNESNADSEINPENRTILKEPGVTVFDPEYKESSLDDDILFFKQD